MANGKPNFRVNDKVKIVEGALTGQVGEIVKVIHEGWNNHAYRVRIETKNSPWKFVIFLQDSIVRCSIS